MADERLRAAAREAAAGHPTPFYVLDLDAIASRARRFLSDWRALFPGVRAAYSYKTNALRGVTRLLRELGLGAEVVSGPELEWAVEDGHAPAAIFFDGPVKLPEELSRALALGVRVQVDSLGELESILGLCGRGEPEPRLSARLATSYRGKRRSRFGLDRDEFERARRSLARRGLRFSGLHLHVGSNVASPDVHVAALEEYADLLVEELRGGLALLDLGGGFPARSLGREAKPPEPLEFADRVAEFMDRRRIARDTVELVLEPGRCLVEDCGVLVSRVAVRKRREHGDLLVLDAGTNLAASVRGWFHPVLIDGPSAEPPGPSYALFGSNCFESDLFAEGVPGPASAGPGDLVLVGSAGGYDLPSANVWIRPSPAVFGLRDGRLCVLRRAQDWREMRDRQP